MKVSHFGGKGGLNFNLNKAWHHSHGFKDSNITIQSLQNFSLTMFYALMWPDFQIILSSSRIGHMKKIFLKGRGFQGGSWDGDTLYFIWATQYFIFLFNYILTMINFNYFWNSVINIILEWTRPRRSWKRTWRAGTRRCGQSIIWQGQGNQEGRNWQERREWFWLRPSKSREIRVWFRSCHWKKKSWKIWTSIIARRFNKL